MSSKYKATFDVLGKPTAFYHDDIHGNKIPESAVSITETDYNAFIQEPGKWIWKDGKRIAAPVVAPTTVEIINGLEGIIRRHMDDVARERNYDSILSLCSYATSTNSTFASEGHSGVAWRDAVYAKFIEVSASITAGGPAPTEKQLIATLPTMIWP